MAQSGLEGDASRTIDPRKKLVSVDETGKHLAFPAVRLLSQREKDTRSGSRNLRANTTLLRV